jgi:carbon storage regulator
MLVISRRVGERVRIGPNIWVMVTRIEEGAVRIAIDAPRHLNIVREELLVRAKAKEAAT